ncbi:copper-activated transcription factor GRISEA, putative [Talaromyces stipitatus ATCC 10500]|uniref:Copper-activated transcription factor GRISEA, putative n=1 Tax=Talaromyces stipitatus (strain ATCC 10500 / CBS 375.48 / QM 6759 / NRRL 1006) TaxID=441959 RepID=B8M295_TALSN|nr:copper-activated transcription factor GRISEA, putative [Talaromyces stipitatus ATCC 10500]EED21559.1 copper-activated transcription factor GRISEA, putative [Talaromyces stipitatus ATCC 10500]
MPLDEEGAKWSCEPCMRGHRSSKCQHFDRLMMKVPKAGRPLAKCPHPKGTCSCEKVYAFMVRIPKGSTCLCRPLYQVPASSATETPSVPATPRPPSLPPDPTSSISKTAAAGRVQKHTRKQSTFQNPSDNIIKALDSELMQAERKNDFGISEQPPTLDRSSAYTPVSGNSHTPSYNPSQKLPEKVAAESKPGGCCSAKIEPVTPAPEPQRSCCGDNATSREEKEQFPSISKNPSTPAWNESFYSSQNLAWNTQLPNTDFTSQNNTYTTTNLTRPYYANQPQSTQPAIPRTFQNLDAHYQLNISGPPMHQFYLNTATYPFNMSLPFVNDSNHDCSCGDSCQCLGCASHPFNETTRHHVQEMGYMMTVKEDEEKSGTSSPFAGLNSPPAMPSNIPANYNLPIPLNTQPSFTDDNTLPSTFDNTINSPTFAPNQFMQPSEYYTLEYPVGLNLCSDITGTCQCGNDCNCVGCITHSGHDGVVLDSMPPESQPMTSKPTPQQRFQDYYNQGSDIPRSMDRYSPSALSPPVVETPLV